jgi:hypothetical protein
MPRTAAAVEAEAEASTAAEAEASTAACPSVASMEAAAAVSMQEAAVAASGEDRSAAASMTARPPVAFMAGVCGAFLEQVLVASTLADFPAAAFAPIQHRAREWIDLPAAREKGRAATPRCFVAANGPAIGITAGITGTLAIGGVTTRIFGRMMAAMTIPTQMASPMVRNLGTIARIPPAIIRP